MLNEVNKQNKIVKLEKSNSPDHREEISGPQRIFCLEIDF